MDWSDVTLYIGGGLAVLFLLFLAAVIIFSEVDLSTPLAKWRTVAIASTIALIASGFDTGFSGWVFIAGVAIFAVSVELFDEWLKRRRRRPARPGSRRARESAAEVDAYQRQYNLMRHLTKDHEVSAAEIPATHEAQMAFHKDELHAGEGVSGWGTF